MSLQSVRAFLDECAPDLQIIEKSISTATVDEAAEAHGVAPGQIAKTMSLWLKDEVILVVLGGDARIDNQKFKAQFKGKAKMLSAEDVVKWTSHPVGGVCPFGLPQRLRIYADVNLKKFDVVLPAAGSTNSALRISPDRLALLVEAEWVDIARAPVDAAA